jgi:hypothetical protein
VFIIACLFKKQMMKKFITAVIFLFAAQLLVNAQNKDSRFGFKSFEINDKKYGKILYHVSAAGLHEKKPVLLYLDGSGPMPLFQYTPRGIGSTVPLNTNELSKKYHLVLISKPGVPFIDSVSTDPATGMPQYDAPAAYDEQLSLEWRVNTADLVLKEIQKKLPVEKKKIAVLGISEGFQVGSKLLTVNRSVTHAVLLVGNGLNQLFDFIIFNRIQASAGSISKQQAQQNIDSLYQQYKTMYADANATDKKWYGHTYKRWVDFSKNIPLDNLLQTNIPVLVVAASDDENTTVLSTDYIRLESIKKGKTNIDFKVYPYTHSFNERVTGEDGKTTHMKNHLSSVMKDTLDWLEKL